MKSGYVQPRAVGRYLAAILVTRRDQKVDLASRPLDKCQGSGVRINLLTLDREFYTREVMRLLNDWGIRFLMPATRTGSVVKAIKEHRAGRRAAVSRHTITSSSPRLVEWFTLVIRPAKSARDAAEVETGEKGDDGAITGDRPTYHVFATSVVPCCDARPRDIHAKRHISSLPSTSGVVFWMVNVKGVHASCSKY